MLKEIKILSQYKSNFSVTSMGGNNNTPLISSNADVYNYDNYAVDYGSKYCIDRPSSHDALYIDHSNRFYFIEFKSGKIEEKDLFFKSYDSIIMMLDVVRNAEELKSFDSFDLIRRNCTFILVYNNTYENKFVSKGREKINSHIRKQAKEAPKFIFMKKIKHFLYSEVVALSAEDFSKLYKPIFNL